MGRTRPRPEPENDADRRHMALIDKFGWATWDVGAGEREDEPGFAYSTGIWETLDQPELLVFGLRGEVARWVVNEYATRAKVAGIIPGQRYEGFLEGFDVVFVSVDYRVASRDYTTWTHWYYNRQSFPLLQLVWPARGNRAFPWEPQYPSDMIKRQPVLGTLPN